VGCENYVACGYYVDEGRYIALAQSRSKSSNKCYFSSGLAFLNRKRAGASA